MKRTVFLMILTLLLISTLTLALHIGQVSSATPNTSCVGASTTVIPWPMFRHDPQHTGCTTSIAPSEFSSLWNASTGAAVNSSPAVANGLVIVGSDDHNVYALNETTGNLLWVRTTGEAVVASPAIDKDMVFAASNDGKIYAFNISTTGLTVWDKQLLSGSGVRLLRSPVVVDGKIYITGSTSGYYYYHSYAFCLNETNGDIIWKHQIFGDQWHCHIPAVHDDVVFVGAGVDRTMSPDLSAVVAINATTGEEVWNCTWSNDWRMYSSPSVTEDRVFIGSNSRGLCAIEKSTGQMLWYTGGTIRSSPAVVDDKIIVGSDNNKVYCFTELGTVVWNYTTGGDVRSSPAVADNKVFVGSADGYIYALDLNSGALIDKFYTGGEVSSSPAVADGLVFVGSDTGKVHAFGKVHQPTEVRFSMDPNPALAGQVVFILGNLTTSDDGPLPGEQVTIARNGTPIADFTTNSTGWFRASGQVISAGTFNITVKYAGSMQYLPSSDWEILVVHKAETEIYTKLDPNPATIDQPVTLKGILVDRFSQPLAAETVRLYARPLAGDWRYITSLTTDTYGIFTWQVTIPEVPTGAYIFAVYYPGSEHYESSYNFAILIIQ